MTVSVMCGSIENMKMSYEMDYAELEKVLSREQIRRYKKEMLSEEEIKDEILTIFK